MVYIAVKKTNSKVNGFGELRCQGKSHSELAMTGTRASCEVRLLQGLVRRHGHPLHLLRCAEWLAGATGCPERDRSRTWAGRNGIKVVLA